MKNIEPIQYTNEPVLATQLLVVSVNDDLTSQCSFDWKLFDVNDTLVDNGILVCTGTDYSNWSGDNNYPYLFVVSQLNLTIVT